MDIRIENHSAEDYLEVARLHAQNIKDGFLSSLGIPFLALLYKAIDSSEESVLIVAKEGDSILGFVSGASGMGSIYRKLLPSFPKVIWALMPSVFRPSRMRKILEILYLGKDDQSSSSLPNEELLSVVVDPSQRGSGLAETLFTALCDYFRERKASGFRIVVGDSLPRAHRFYQKMGSEPVGKIEVHKGEYSTIYLKDCGISQKH